MKIEKYHFILAVVVGILCVPALGNIKVLKSGERQQIRRPWGVLSNIDTIDKVDMTILCPDPNEDTEFWKNLDDKVAATLPERIKLQLSFRNYLDNIYKIRIEILQFEDSSNYAARVQSLLTRYVHINNGFALADVWMAEPAMQIVQKQNLHEAVSEMVMEQVKEFISDYQKANPTDKQPSGENNIGIVLKEPLKPAPKSTPAEYKYVASKNSKVFHKPECSSAKRIKPENLIGYSSRDEAINAGKRPCKRCKP
jgi:hypothetical protein